MCSGQNISLSLHHPLSGILRSPPLAFGLRRVCARARARVPECVSVCLGAPPLYPESSTQLDSGCVLRPHIMPNFSEGASQLIWSVFVGGGGMAACDTEEVAAFKSTLSRRRHIARRRPLSSQNCQATKGGARAANASGLICHVRRCHGSTATS